MCVAKEVAEYDCFDEEMIFESGLVYLKYPKYVSLRCCSIIPKLSLVSVIVCVRVCMLFCWASAELLLFFLPPRPKADSLSKQALSLPSNGETAFWTDAFGLHFLFYPLWNACKSRFLFWWISRKWKGMWGNNGRTCLSSCVVFFVLCQWHKKKQLEVNVMTEN